MFHVPNRRIFLGLCGAATLGGCGLTGDLVGNLFGGGDDGPLSLAPNSRLVLVRHADRDGDELSAEGHARAALLDGALADIPLDAVFSPGLSRNLDTATPLAEARGLEITRMPMENVAPRLVAQGAGRSVIWVGNRGNLTDIWEALGLEGPPPLEYGDLFVVERDAEGAVTVTRERFGPAA